VVCSIIIFGGHVLFYELLPCHRELIFKNYTNKRPYCFSVKLVYFVYSIPKQAQKSFLGISRVSVELHTNVSVSELSSVSIIRVDVVNDHLLLIFIVRNCGVTHPTLTYHHVAKPGVPVVRLFVSFLTCSSSCFLGIFVMYVC
jgi:hypothetical protein